MLMDCAAAGGHDQLVVLLIDAEADVAPTDKSKVHLYNTDNDWVPALSL